ncbi:MAG: glycosyltransferase, partial [Halobacteriaceae archaeon]
MTSHVAVAHYPEGAGHATRMMGVARALQARGATVTLAGGGPGTRFYDANGFGAFEPTRVDYVRDFQHAGGPVRGLGQVVTSSLPDSGRRLRDVAGWLREEDPDAVVTDDMFAAGAAVRTGTPLYVLTHNAASFYRSLVVRVASRGLNLGQRLAARRFFYPTVWPPHAGDPPQVSRVPPVALDPPPGAADAGPENPGVVVVPSAYSDAFGGVVDRLRDAGRTVTHVGDPDWEAVP